MKKSIVVLLVCFFSIGSSFAQKYAYVDTEYVLSKIPEYETAQQEIDRLSEQWQQEIEGKYKAVDKKFKEFQADMLLLPDEMKKKREEEIIELEKSAKDLQKRRFGVNGDLFKKREELIKPIQDRIFTAIQEMASSSNYAFVFDKSNQSNLIFADPKYDKSDAVLKKMGIK